MPGGIVVVTQGLIDAASRQEELAGVVAHEVAHVDAPAPSRRSGAGRLLEARGGTVRRSEPCVGRKDPCPRP